MQRVPLAGEVRTLLRSLAQTTASRWLGERETGWLERSGAVAGRHLSLFCLLYAEACERLPVQRQHEHKGAREASCLSPSVFSRESVNSLWIPLIDQFGFGLPSLPRDCELPAGRARACLVLQHLVLEPGCLVNSERMAVGAVQPWVKSPFGMPVSHSAVMGSGPGCSASDPASC